MKGFQYHTIDPFPLLIKEKHWVEISYTRLAENTEQHVKEDLSGQFISCPEPVNEKISPRINRPVSTLYLPNNIE